ncbi:MAG: hypothetical protein AB8F94_08335 [Saprospiraceae bacterium]
MKIKSFSIICISIVIIIALLSCTSDSASQKEKSTPIQEVVFVKEKIKKSVYPKDRTEILKRLQQKIAGKKTLVIHAFVPLCDNDNQGIVPVSKSLGNGLNLRTNLYWGALYGVKTHFKKQKDWELLFSKKDLSENVLERVVFFKKYKNGAQVYFVADAYRGDQMAACLTDYFSALSNENQSDFNFLDKKIGVEGKADLIVFNGHNGLMDTSVEFPNNIHTSAKDAIAIACVSFDYFKEYYQQVNAYPLLNTKNLLAPEAYVLENVFDAWAMLEDGEAIHHAAGSAYNQYQKCGLRGAKRLFQSGW